NDDVPQDTILMAFHMPGRNNPDYRAADLISDILANGKSSRFYSGLVREKQVFSDLDAYIWGSEDPGLLIVHGFPANGISLDEAENLIWEELEMLKKEGCNKDELAKVKNKAISAWMFSNIAINNKAHHLAFFEHMGDTGLINKEDSLVDAVDMERINRVIKRILRKDNASVLKYYAKK
ncbi:MAG TPA: insulinase family protein, partial [Prolixibacteraceae bacterium]|nr:insulinase family protein [Prolixibacteraceae bacterium]